MGFNESFHRHGTLFITSAAIRLAEAERPPWPRCVAAARLTTEQSQRTLSEHPAKTLCIPWQGGETINMDSINLPMFTVDQHGSICSMNPAFLLTLHSVGVAGTESPRSVLVCRRRQ